MKTKRLISSISYNSDLFLSVTMHKLVASGSIDWGHWIRHMPETDETKIHYHLLVQPSKALDTLSLSMQFHEVDPVDPKMLLGCMPWRFSKFSDWILYCLHDPAYLASKALERDKHYTIDEVLSTHPDMLREDYKQIDLRAYGVGSFLHDAVKHGRTWESVMASGQIPCSHWRYWKEVFGAMGGTFRNLSASPL